MDDTIILTELQALARSMPPFMTTPGYIFKRSLVNSDLEWLGTVIAHLTQWDDIKAISVRSTISTLTTTMFDSHVVTIKATMFEAIADLKARVQQRPGGAFAANSVYDYFRALKDTVSNATSDLFIADPYLDDEIFDYVSVAEAGASIRLLTMQKNQRQQQLMAALRAARAKFQQQYGRQVEVRASNSFHDRVIFIDKRTCWLSGASIKDAAKRAPTYLAALPLDLVQDKLSDYETIWQSAAVI